MPELHLVATFVIIGATIIAYASERWAMETVSLVSLAAILILFGAVPYSGAGAEILSAERLLAGFSNPALITVIALLIVGQGLFATDAMEAPARRLGKMGGSSTFRPILFILVGAAVISAFLNNTPVVVIFIPILVVIAAQRSISASRVFIPLSFITILGGMTTLIGSSTNLLVAGVARDYGHEVGFFDITGMGVILALVGGVYVLGVLPRILPEREAQLSAGAKSGAQFIGEITLTRDHPFVGISAKAGMFPGLGDLTLRLLQRRDIPVLPPFEDLTLSAGDTLVVSGTRRAFSKALSRGRAGLKADDGPVEDTSKDPPPGPDYHLAEAVISPGSRYAGRTIQLSGLRPQFGISVLGVQRKSRMARSAMSDIRLEPGDTLLIGGPMEAIAQLRGNHDLLLLEYSAEAVPQSRKARIAVAIFAAIVVLSAFSLLPIVVAAVCGAVLMLLTGCLSILQAARAFDRQIFLLVGSSVALATALETTGGAALIASSALSLMEGASAGVILSGLFLVMAILTNILSNNATAVLFTPIALGIAKGMGVPPEPFIAAVIFAANSSFATPIGYQTNLLVMGPGHYRFSDFLRAGTPLVLIIWLTFSLLAPWYYGL
ncbi:MAG: SLC13 family permease [Hoeflea sp.]|uniref:SLC13 family permease n=1 Tax=Hoeflea sp. TaxID=1940281 RepID=UPI001DA0C440|nr:SLC13 family permease [Hoeflea sp.]MBU4530052.1 SLC13 family permease [Alphaproteobacteria bacterium]MBU4542663.1 SLC13 family permease [Alphaproteobacteria bacterium]MBU4551344.1 SLC13 family permease [Alphaproteobacteria bacterium]MBV1723167.1 SLC13 family permease [Hoeflea sp.]MBV1760178.1 SLC13 family permease [Hoeflea sp.]